MTPNYPDIRITILGSGTCVPSLNRSACSVLMQTAGDNLLLDAGPGTMRRLLEAGLSVSDITYVFLSHFHPDHTGELAPFLFSNKYPGDRRRTTPLALVSGTGFSAFFDKLKGVYGEWIDLGPDLLRIFEIDNTAIHTRVFGDFSVTFGPVHHNPESTAYRITGPHGKSAVYSGDTDFCESLVDLARDADVLICESAFPDAWKVPGHLTPSLAGEIARRANVGKLVLTHFYPECDVEDIRGQCRRSWSGALVLAEDLMGIEVR